MLHGRFDTDVSALRQRICSHERYGTKDLNEWIFSCLDVSPGLSILDLGCGTGKQTIPLAQIVEATGHVSAVDIAADALSVVSQAAQELGLTNRISLVHCSIDDLAGHLTDHCFDRVVASYSLYYANDPIKVIALIHQVLRSGGHLFFCGPSRRNNAELYEFHHALTSEPRPRVSKVAVFMEETGQRLSQEQFSSMDVFTFENPLRFDSAEALYAYWSSHNIYDEKIDARFRAAATSYFRTASLFETVKRVIGVRATK